MQVNDISRAGTNTLPKIFNLLNLIQVYFVDIGTHRAKASQSRTTSVAADFHKRVPKPPASNTTGTELIMVP